MRDVLLKKLIYVVSYMILALFMEFITFNVMGLGVFAEYYWFDILMVALIAMFIFIIPSFKVEAVIIILMLAIQATLSFVNQAMNNDAMLRVVFTFSDLFSTTAVAGVFTNEYVSWPFLVALVLIVLTEFAILLYLRRIRVETVIRTRVLATSFVVFMVCQILLGSFYGYACASLYSPSKEDSAYYFKNDKTLYENMDYAFKLKAFEKFGTFSFYYKNFINFIDLKSNKDIVGMLDEANEFLSDGEQSSESGQLYTPYTGAYNGNNLIMVMMESAEWYGIDKDLTPTLYALANQGITNDKYISKNKTNQSEAISILGSFPTTCNLQEKLKSSTSEDYPFSLPSVFKRDGYNTSYMHNNVAEFYNREVTHNSLGFDNLYFYEDMIAEEGFVSHKKNTTDFYDFESDYEALRVMKDKIASVSSGKPFMSFYTTMCMHGNYDDLIDYSKKTYGDNRWDYTVDTPVKEKEAFRSDKDTNDFFCDYYEQITIEHFEELFPNITNVLDKNSSEYRDCYLRYKQYQAAYMDLDRGLHELIVYLQEADLLENTTIVLFADHDGYYSNQNYYLRGYSYFEFYKTDLYFVPFIMYDGSLDLNVSSVDYGNGLGYEAFNYDSSISPKLDESKCEYLKTENGSLKIQRWSSPYDTVPTLLDLFGYSFNKNLYQGESFFADYTDLERAVFYSMESGTITDNMFMSSIGNLYCYDDETDEYYWVVGGEDEIRYVKDNSIYEDVDGRISEKFRNFSVQFDIFIRKKEHLDNIYKYKFFAKRDVKNSEGSVMYDFSDIAKNVYKV